MNGYCYYSEGINPTLTCVHDACNKVAIPVLTPDRAVKRQNGRRFKEDGDPSFTLTSQDRHGVAVEVDMTGYNATLKSGGGVTETSRALNARDYKGLSGGSQMMTAAAMCLRLTKAQEQKSAKSQTVSQPEKTEDSLGESKKEH